MRNGEAHDRKGYRRKPQPQIRPLTLQQRPMRNDRCDRGEGQAEAAVRRSSVKMPGAVELFVQAG
jgi:hypothetical protein